MFVLLLVHTYVRIFVYVLACIFTYLEIFPLIVGGKEWDKGRESEKRRVREGGREEEMECCNQNFFLFLTLW